MSFQAVRMSAASTPAGDGGEVGRLRIGETAEKWGKGFVGEVVVGGNRFWVKSNLAVARLAKRAIAKIAIAVFTKRAPVIAM